MTTGGCNCTRLERVTGNGCINCNPEKSYEYAKRMHGELSAFLINSMREAKKGYYDEDEIWIQGYCSACEDLLERFVDDIRS